MHSVDLEYWLKLSQMPKIGSARIKSLYQHFKDIRKVWDAGCDDLSAARLISKQAAEQIIAQRGGLDKQKEYRDAIPAGVEAIVLSDARYPRKLMEIYDPPAILYVHGDVSAMHEMAIAVVGTRHPSVYGRSQASMIAKGLAQNGLLVVSGLAEGIDACAHRAALQANKKTVAVLGSGINMLYPKTNEKLAEEIISNGAIISEFPINYPPSKYTFPQRNRIISGLSNGVVVVEGALDSGALITADFALEQGRDVFALPGNVDMPLSAGPNQLIKQGAKLVSTIQDVLDELGISASKVKESAGNPDFSFLLEDERNVCIVLHAHGIKSVDDIILEIGCPPSKAAEILARLEIKGKVKKLPGSQYALA